MIETIRKCIRHLEGLSGWIVTREVVESAEAYYIKKELDITRMSDVTSYTIQLFCDYEADGKKTRGDAKAAVHTGMTETEIKATLKKILLSAKAVRNEWYPLPIPYPCEAHTKAVSNLEGKPLMTWIPECAKPFMDLPSDPRGGLNSLELFLRKKSVSVFTSEGIERTHDSYDCFCEYVMDWKEGKTDTVESYDSFSFSSFFPDAVALRINTCLDRVRDRSRAVPLRAKADFPVILNDEAAKEYFDYFSFKTRAFAVYNRYSECKTGDDFTNGSRNCDTPTIEGVVDLEGSVHSCPFDPDGYPRRDFTAVKDGIASTLFGESRFAHYLKIDTPGNVLNRKIRGGSVPKKDMFAFPHVEIAAFSDFSCDKLTGSIAGEIRLAYLFDGKTRTPMTGGSFSGMIPELAKEARFSVETVRNQDYDGPEYMMLTGGTLANV